MPGIPYAIEVVHIPTDPPMTWPIVVVSAEVEDPARLTRQLILPGIPLQLNADRSPKGLEPLLYHLEQKARGQCRRLGLNLKRFVTPHEKLAAETRDRQVAAILDMIRPKVKGAPLIVGGRPQKEIP